MDHIIVSFLDHANNWSQNPMQYTLITKPATSYNTATHQEEKTNQNINGGVSSKGRPPSVSIRKTGKIYYQDNPVQKRRFDQYYYSTLTNLDEPLYFSMMGRRIYIILHGVNVMSTVLQL